MSKYIDGFVFCVPKKNFKVYKEMAKFAKNIWMDHGALEYVESTGVDMKPKYAVMTFPKLVKPKKGEIVMFSFIIYNSKKHRDSVNAKVMKDKRLHKYANKPMPFDMKRMAVGGFSAIVYDRKK